MPGSTLTFDAIEEAQPGPKWAARWARSWPAYEHWFVARGGDNGPTRAQSEAALAEHMPELMPVYRKLLTLAGGSDRAARFLSAWCPPNYLGGCSLAGVARGDEVRLLRNYDLSPDLNEGLLLRSRWRRPVMGMIEFLWGLSDGINDSGLSVALAFGGRQATATGFGITVILRYVLETCDTVAEAIRVLQRVPSHMPYNVVLADASGAVASVEMMAGGGAHVRPKAVATNHQHDGSQPDRAAFTRTFERADHLEKVVQDNDPADIAEIFLSEPLRQSRFNEGFGTLFTAEYDPVACAMALHWPDRVWRQRLDSFEEGRQVINYDRAAPARYGNVSNPAAIDWVAFGKACAEGRMPDWRTVSAWAFKEAC